MVRSQLGRRCLQPAEFHPPPDKGALASLEQRLKEIDEECRVEERRRVDLELNIVEVKDNLKKAEAGPVTLGTTVDTTHLENVSPRVSGGSRGASVPPAAPPGVGLGGRAPRPSAQALLSSYPLQPKAATPTPAPDCTPVNSATALKNRPLSVMVTGKGTVLQKAKVSGHTQPPSGPPGQTVAKVGPPLLARVALPCFRHQL